MTTSVGTAPNDIQRLPQTESSTDIVEASLPIGWNPSKEFTTGSVFAVHGDGNSIKSVEDFLEVINGDYVVYIHGYENSSNSPATLPEAETDAFEPVGIWLDHSTDFGVFNVRPDRYGLSLLGSKKPWATHGDVTHRTVLANPALRWGVGLLDTPAPDLDVGHAGYQRQRLSDFWHAHQETPARIENVTRHQLDDKVNGTSPSPVGGYSVDRAKSALAKAVGLLANISSDLGVGHVRYQRQAGDFFSLISRYSPGGVTDTDFREHVLRRMHIRSALDRAFRDGSEEVFEYGMESSFSRTLDSLIRSYSNDAVVEVKRILTHTDISLDVKEECLLQLGAIEHNPTSQSRLSLLIDHLWSEQVGVRDCAALGMASMDDPSAIHLIQHAVRVEKSDRLREDLQLVLDQLIATRNAQLLQSHS